MRYLRASLTWLTRTLSLLALSLLGVTGALHLAFLWASRDDESSGLLLGAGMLALLAPAIPVFMAVPAAVYASNMTGASDRSDTIWGHLGRAALVSALSAVGCSLLIVVVNPVLGALAAVLTVCAFVPSAVLIELLVRFTGRALRRLPKRCRPRPRGPTCGPQ